MRMNYSDTIIICEILYFTRFFNILLWAEDLLEKSLKHVFTLDLIIYLVGNRPGLYRTLSFGCFSHNDARSGV